MSVGIHKYLVRVILDYYGIWQGPCSFRTLMTNRARLWKLEGRNIMLETIAIILLVLWLLGVVSGYTLGNFIYILLVIGIVLLLVRFIRRA
jgi:hypothetical protein